MSQRKCKKISIPFSSSKKPKRWKSDGTEEFSVKWALCDRGLYYFVQPRWMRILSLSFWYVCGQWTLTGSACWAACFSVPPQDFPFLASWGMVIKNIWRSKRCKVEHNTNSADKIFCVKEIAAVYKQTFQSSWSFVLWTISLWRSFTPEL